MRPDQLRPYLAVPVEITLRTTHLPDDSDPTTSWCLEVKGWGFVQAFWTNDEKVAKSWPKVGTLWLMKCSFQGGDSRIPFTFIDPTFSPLEGSAKRGASRAKKAKT
jgi:hypothetical protein